MSESRPSSPTKITIKVTHNKLALPSKPCVEKNLSIDKGDFDRIRSKYDLIKHLAPALGLNLNDIDQLKLLRKSKKHKEYVALESSEDFKSLARSLKVKNHIKLVINDQSTDSTSSSDSTNASSSTNKKRKIQTMDFSSLGDALLEAAFEHFKELFNDDAGATAATSSASVATATDDGANASGSTAAAAAATTTSDIKSEKPSGPTPTAASSSDEKLKLEIDEFIHTTVACDSCNPDDFVPIKGIRFACTVCPNFDLCEACETNQHINKTNIGSHSYKHPMTKVAYPEIEFDRRRFGRRGGCPVYQSFPEAFSRHHFRHGRNPFQARGGFQPWNATDSHPPHPPPPPPPPHHHHHHHHHARHAPHDRPNHPSPPPPPPPPFYSFFPTPSHSSDLIFDIPLENCNAETKSKLESFLQAEGINSFIKNVQGYVDNTERYKGLLRTAGLENFENDKLAFSLLSGMFMKSIFTRSSTSPPPTDPSHSYSSSSESHSDDLVYDIPLENCNDETKAKLESFFESEDIKAFMKNVQFYVDNGERYEKLLRMASIEDGENQLDDELKFTLLKSLLDSVKSKKSPPTPPGSSESVTPAPEISEESTVMVPKQPIDGTDKVVISTKRIGNNSRVISLMLTNNTSHIISGGDLKFEFYDSSFNEMVYVKNANSVKPGQTRFYNLGGINDLFKENTSMDRRFNMNMRLTTANGVLEGAYKYFEDSTLSFVSVDDSMDVDPKDESLTLSNKDEVNVTLVPKSSSLAQIIIHNRSEKTVDCSDLKLEIVNCFGKSVVAVMIRKSHGILPGKIGKFNIGLINAHMKFPFKLIMRNDYNIGHCELSLKNLSGNFNFEPEEVVDQQPDLINLEQTPEFDDGTNHDTVMDDDDNNHSSGTESILDEKEEIEVVEVANPFKEKETPESEELASSSIEGGSIHSIIVPSLPKESALVDSEYSDAKDTVTTESKDEAEVKNHPIEQAHDDDYDIISVEGEADHDNDFDSDFEILSPVTSHNQ